MFKQSSFAYILFLIPKENVFIVHFHHFIASTIHFNSAYEV